MLNQGANAVNLKTMQFTLAGVDNSANQYTGIWQSSGPAVSSLAWTSGPSTCINNVLPCVSAAAATAFTKANFGAGVSLWCDRRGACALAAAPLYRTPRLPPAR